MLPILKAPDDAKEHLIVFVLINDIPTNSTQSPTARGFIKLFSFFKKIVYTAGNAWLRNKYWPVASSE
jgi:hypothetical protein